MSEETLGSEGQEVKHLQAVLEVETKTREQQQEYNSKLQEEYDVLLKKLAAAELHIDRLRLRANVDLNKRFILSHDSIQTTVLQQGLDASYNPASWKEGGVPGIGSREESAGPLSGDASLGSGGMDHGYWKNSSGERDMTTSPLLPPNDDRVIQSGSGRTPAPIQGYNPLPPSSRVSPNPQQVLSKHRGFEGEQHVPRNTSQSLLEALDDSAASVPHLLLSQTLSEGQSETLSQMSAGFIKTQASAESQHLSQIFQIRSLQEQIGSLKDKLNGDQGSFEELSEDLGHILQEHETLTGNFELSGQQLESLQERYKDRASQVISQRKAAFENELVALAEQLKELDVLLRHKTSNAQANSRGGPKHSTPFSPQLSCDGSEGNISNDSLSSPSLPSRYLSRGVNLNSTNTSAELAHDSRSPFSDDAAMESRSLVSNLAEDLELGVSPYRVGGGRGRDSPDARDNGVSLDSDIHDREKRRRENKGLGHLEPTMTPGSGEKQKKRTLRSRIPQRIHHSYSSPPKLVPLRKAHPFSARTETDGGRSATSLRKTSCPAIMESGDGEEGQNERPVLNDSLNGNNQPSDGDSGLPKGAGREASERRPKELSKGTGSKVTGMPRAPRGTEDEPWIGSKAWRGTAEPSWVSQGEEVPGGPIARQPPQFRTLPSGGTAVPGPPISNHSTAHSIGGTPEPRQQQQRQQYGVKDSLGTNALGMLGDQVAELTLAAQQTKGALLQQRRDLGAEQTDVSQVQSPQQALPQGALTQGVPSQGVLPQGTQPLTPQQRDIWTLSQVQPQQSDNTVIHGIQTLPQGVQRGAHQILPPWMPSQTLPSQQGAQQGDTGTLQQGSVVSQQGHVGGPHQTLPPWMTSQQGDTGTLQQGSVVSQQGEVGGPHQTLPPWMTSQQGDTGTLQQGSVVSQQGEVGGPHQTLPPWMTSQQGDTRTLQQSTVASLQQGEVGGPHQTLPPWMISQQGDTGQSAVSSLQQGEVGGPHQPWMTSFQQMGTLPQAMSWFPGAAITPLHRGALQHGASWSVGMSPAPTGSSGLFPPTPEHVGGPHHSPAPTVVSSHHPLGTPIQTPALSVDTSLHPSFMGVAGTSVSTPAWSSSLWPASIQAPFHQAMGNQQALGTPVQTPSHSAPLWQAPAQTLLQQAVSTPVQTPSHRAPLWQAPAQTLLQQAVSTPVQTPSHSAPLWQAPAQTLLQQAVSTPVQTPSHNAPLWQAPAQTLLQQAVSTPVQTPLLWQAPGQIPFQQMVSTPAQAPIHTTPLWQVAALSSQLPQPSLLMSTDPPSAQSGESHVHQPTHTSLPSEGNPSLSSSPTRLPPSYVSTHPSLSTPRSIPSSPLQLIPPTPLPTPLSDHSLISRQPASTILSGHSHPSTNQPITSQLDPTTPGSSSTSHRSKESEGFMKMKQKENPKLTLATVDALRKELVSLRDQIMRSSSPSAASLPQATAETTTTRDSAPPALDHTHSLIQTRSSVESHSFSSAVCSMESRGATSVLTALAPSIPSTAPPLSVHTYKSHSRDNLSMSSRRLRRSYLAKGRELLHTPQLTGSEMGTGSTPSLSGGRNSLPWNSPVHGSGMESGQTPSGGSGMQLEPPRNTPTHHGTEIRMSTPFVTPVRNSGAWYGNSPSLPHDSLATPLGSQSPSSRISKDPHPPSNPSTPSATLSSARTFTPEPTLTADSAAPLGCSFTESQLGSYGMEGVSGGSQVGFEGHGGSQLSVQGIGSFEQGGSYSKVTSEHSLGLEGTQNTSLSSFGCHSPRERHGSAGKQSGGAHSQTLHRERRGSAGKPSNEAHLQSVHRERRGLAEKPSDESHLLSVHRERRVSAEKTHHEERRGSAGKLLDKTHRRGSAGNLWDGNQSSDPLRHQSRSEVKSNDRLQSVALSAETMGSGRRGSEQDTLAPDHEVQQVGSGLSWGSWKSYPLHQSRSIALSAQVRRDASNMEEEGRDSVSAWDGGTDQDIRGQETGRGGTLMHDHRSQGNSGGRSVLVQDQRQQVSSLSQERGQGATAASGQPHSQSHVPMSPGQTDAATHLHKQQSEDWNAGSWMRPPNQAIFQTTPPRGHQQLRDQGTFSLQDKHQNAGSHRTSSPPKGQLYLKNTTTQGAKSLTTSSLGLRDTAAQDAPYLHSKHGFHETKSPLLKGRIVIDATTQMESGGGGMDGHGLGGRQDGGSRQRGGYDGTLDGQLGGRQDGGSRQRGGYDGTLDGQLGGWQDGGSRQRGEYDAALDGQQREVQDSRPQRGGQDARPSDGEGDVHPSPSHGYPYSPLHPSYRFRHASNLSNLLATSHTSLVSQSAHSPVIYTPTSPHVFTSRSASYLSHPPTISTPHTAPAQDRRHVYGDRDNGSSSDCDAEIGRTPTASTPIPPTRATPPPPSPRHRSRHLTPPHTFPSAHVSPIHSHLFSTHPPSDDEEGGRARKHVFIYTNRQPPPAPLPRGAEHGYQHSRTVLYPKGASSEGGRYYEDGGRVRSPYVTTPLSAHGHKSQQFHSSSSHRGHYGEGQSFCRGGEDREVDRGWPRHGWDEWDARGRDGWERREEGKRGTREMDGDRIGHRGQRGNGGHEHRERGHDHIRGREGLTAGDGVGYKQGRDPLLVVNILKDGESREAIGGRREEVSAAKAHKNVYVLNQEMTSSDSDFEPDQLQMVDGGKINLKGAVRLARQLRRRSERMRGALQLELAKQGLL